MDPQKDAEIVSDAVAAALHAAVQHAQPVKVGEIRQVAMTFDAPLNVEQVKSDLEKYRTAPEKCTSGWVDAEFAKEYAGAALAWDLTKTTYATPMTALRLGDAAIFANGSLHNVDEAVAALDDGADIVTIGRGALVNPDLPRRLANRDTLNDFDPTILGPIANIKETELVT